MKISIKREALVWALNTVGNTLPVKSSMPSLTGIRMETKDGKLEFVSSNGETSSRVYVDLVEVSENGTILVPGKMFSNVIKSLSADTIVLNSDGNNCEIIADRGKYQLRLIDIASYPEIAFGNENDNESVNFTIQNEKLSILIKAVSNSVSTSEKKPILTGVNLKCEEGKLIATATDTFRLSQKVVEVGNDITTDFSITIPMASVNAILNSTKPEEVLNMSIHKTRLFMSSNSLDFVSILLDGNYPDTKRLTSLSFANVFEFKKLDLLNAIDRAVVLSPSDTAKDREITYNVVTVKSIDSENAMLRVVNGMIGEANELVSYKAIQGESFSFAVNGKYLTDAIKGLNGDVIKININDGKTPFTVSSDLDTSNYQLLLPVRLGD